MEIDFCFWVEPFEFDIYELNVLFNKQTISQLTVSKLIIVSGSECTYRVTSAVVLISHGDIIIIILETLALRHFYLFELSDDVVVCKLIVDKF